MADLQQGGNAPVAGTSLTVRVEGVPAPGVDLDVSAYLLCENGKVRGDADMIFYNQPVDADEAVRFKKDAGALGIFDIDLARLSGSIVRIVFCMTIDEAVTRKQTLSQVTSAKISIGELVFTPSLSNATEAAMILGELYQRNGAWKFRAVGQGFNGGLAPLARSFGIDVAEEAQPLSPPPALPTPPLLSAATPSPAPTTAPAAPASPPSSAPVNLSKISLEKPGQAISLEKRGGSFGEISINLNWTRGKKGFFGGSAIDLDLGCLLEMANGDKSVVQALGRMFGSYDQWPFIALSGDDRTGDISSGETMRINGARWNDIRRIAIFANIYDGAPNWNTTDGIVTVTMPDQPPIEVRMTEGRNDKRLCGVILLENVSGTLKASRIVDYFRDQSELDRAFGWGLNWRAGSKD